MSDIPKARRLLDELEERIREPGLFDRITAEEALNRLAAAKRHMWRGKNHEDQDH